ncbi:helix-turn-helix domain-containing protein [Enterococcus sp. BWR-S5]|uniref:helix-turn-helix domain-containing protein n=1 Tax=Enterococcus sp. BWR-S5 TaxID=2787714 RepID=UPI001924FCF1|nr:helix-turn-helix domain-containing protein [Enterococcus sp. BWR-S5]MBL1226269.1 helix-turn-helix transcriptional regulator [Enterococcus sp. BWR-S5]
MWMNRILNQEVRHVAIHEFVRSDNPLLPIKIWNQQLGGPELSSPVHWHRSLEILFVASGRVGLMIEGNQQIMMAGDLKIINSGEIHQISAVEAGDEMSGITLLIPSEFIQAWFPEYDQGIFDSSLVYENKSVLTEYIEAIGSLYEQAAPYYEAEIVSLLLKLLLQLYRKTRVPSEEEERVFEIKERLSKVLDIIEQGYQNTLTLEQAAAVAGYSVSYFSKIFTATMKRSFYQYLIDFRLNKSLRELQLANKTITDIAIDNGFSSIHSYIHGFKKAYQMTPKEYQMKIRNRHK